MIVYGFVLLGSVKAFFIPPKTLSTKLGELIPKPTFQQLWSCFLHGVPGFERIPFALRLFNLSLPRLMYAAVPPTLAIPPIMPIPALKDLPILKGENGYCFQNNELFHNVNTFGKMKLTYCIRDWFAVVSICFD